MKFAKNFKTDTTMSKQETIQKLTELMATVQMAYFKGREVGVRVHESPQVSSAAISIDLYHFEGDGLPVCDGLNPCTITFDDGSTDTGELFCMCYDPDDDVTPLVLEFSPDDESDDYDIDPEDVPEDALTNITAWLEGVFQRMPVRTNTN